jgi:hypothetical protein
MLRNFVVSICDMRMRGASLMMSVLAALPLYALALDRDGAIDAAKRQTKSRCGSGTSCTFTTKMENNKWFVRVDFPKPKSPQEKKSPSLGGHAIFVFDQTGKLVGRMEGE